MQLSVIVPFLNEREVLPACLQRLRRVLDGLNESYEIVFVDDGSRDGSAEFLAARVRAEPGLKLLRLSRNFGKEAAMTAGIEHTVGAAIVILDADLQDPPELIPDMVRAWRGARTWSACDAAAAPARAGSSAPRPMPTTGC